MLELFKPQKYIELLNLVPMVSTLNYFLEEKTVNSLNCKLILGEYDNVSGENRLDYQYTAY